MNLSEKLVLTYDNTGATDGVGAQLQRIYGIYSSSRLVGASYLHTGLGYVEYHGLSALEADVADPGYVQDPGFHDEFNDLFRIRSDVSPTADLHTVNLRDLSMEAIDELVAMFDRGATGGRPILVRTVMPYGISDRFPDCYEVCKDISPFASVAREGRALRVVVHVRRGELFVFETQRMLPNAYYINVAGDVARVLEDLQIEYQIELCTEVPSKEIIVQPDHHGILGRASGPVVINAEMSRLDDFDVMPHLVPCINESTMETLRRFATADVLVISRSSLSYVGGLLNRNGIVLYHPFWHSAPSAWMPVDPDGHFDQLKVSQTLERA